MQYKYPRTPHLPYSETIGADDKRLKNDLIFKDKDIVITEKMDGENVTIYNNYFHTRSLDGKHKDYHSYLLNYIKRFQYLIPDNWRICGEYLYVKHSIHYLNLKEYFYAFNIFDENNNCLAYDDFKKQCELLNIFTVPELFVGEYDKKIVTTYAKNIIKMGGEGVVIRNKKMFNYKDFSKNVAKYVRPNHVQTDLHWTHLEKVKNEIIKRK